MMDLLLMVVALACLLVASYSDIKTREIPDWLNFSLLAAALGIRAITATTQGLPIILSGLIGLALCFILALFLYYANQWGGGDSKLLIAMGAVIGVSLPLGKESFRLFWFILGLLFLGMFWGIAWMVGVAIKRKHLFMARFKHVLCANKIVHVILAITTLLLLGFSAIYPGFWLLALFPLPAFYLSIFVTSVEKNCFYSRRLPLELTEGDWLAEDISVNGLTVMFKKTLTKTDLEQLHRLKRNKKINTVLIKEGIPFIPAFLFSFILITFLEQQIYRWLGYIF